MGRSLDLQAMRNMVRCSRNASLCAIAAKNLFAKSLILSKKTRTYTERLAQKVITEVVESALKNVAQRNGLSEKEVETILR